jgi:hypothetical protein
VTWRKICRSIVNPLPKLWMVFFCFPIFPFFFAAPTKLGLFFVIMFLKYNVYTYTYIYNYIYSPISPLLFQYLSCPGLSCFSYIISVCVFMFNYSFAFIWVILCSMVLLTFICCSCSLSVYICWHLPLGPLQVGPQFCRKTPGNETYGNGHFGHWAFRFFCLMSFPCIYIYIQFTYSIHILI